MHLQWTVWCIMVLSVCCADVVDGNIAFGLELSNCCASAQFMRSISSYLPMKNYSLSRRPTTHRMTGSTPQSTLPTVILLPSTCFARKASWCRSAFPSWVALGWSSPNQEQKYYCDVVLCKNRQFVAAGYTFQQDSAPAHRARDTVELLRCETPDFIAPDLCPPPTVRNSTP